MSPKELYNKIILLSSTQLIEFLNKENNQIRLTFLQATSTVENNTAFQGILKTISKLQLTDTLISTQEVQSLYTHLAFYFKKTNNRAFVDACATHIRESIFKKRLSAWLHYKRYNKHSLHISELDNYLKKINAAIGDNHDDYTYEILSDLHEYKKRTVSRLPKDISNRLFALLESEEFVIKYPILKQLQEDNINQLPNVTVKEYTEQEYAPSIFAETIFKESFIDYVSGKSLFGYNMWDATNKIIKKGQANFDLGYANLSASDVVKLYCYCNMRMHYFSSLNLYERSDIIVHFYKTNGRIKFIDIGCGPATCGLAFTDYIYQYTGVPASFDYYGIDSSTAMQEQAKEILCNTAFPQSNISEFHKEISNIDMDSLQNSSCIIINTCYVFASTTLPIQAIIDFIDNLKNKYPYTPTYLLFQNPIDDFLNIKYVEFKKLLSSYESQFEEKREISYYNQRIRWGQPKKRVISYEILKL